MSDIRGWAFPIEIEPLTGRVKEVANEEVVRQSIKMILNTSPGERFYYQDFGCGLQSYVFGLANYSTLKQVEAEVKRSIEKWEKRVELVEVKAWSNNTERVCLDISYKIQNMEAVFHYRHDLDLR